MAKRAKKKENKMKTGELKAIQVDLKLNYGYVYFKETGAVAGHFLL